MTLLFDATNAYLGPLLEKHTTGQPLVWEDLTQSMTACSAVLRQSNNAFVSSRLDKLHQSQVKVYREAAVQSVKEWALSFPLQPMEEGDTKIAFVNRCIASISGSKLLPNWKLDNLRIIAINEVRQRANATYEKYHPVEEDVPDKENEKAAAAVMGGEAGTINGAEVHSEDGVDTEDGEMTGDDDDKSESEQTTSKYVHPNRVKTRSAGVQKSIALRKGTRAKSGFRNNQGGRGARRGGRGGGNRLQK